MLNNDIEIEVFRKTIRKLTFTYCIPSSTLCDLAYRKEYFDEAGYEPEQGVPPELYVNTYKKYSRILKRLCVKKDLKLPVKKLFAQPKIYDEIMFDRQCKLYNKPAAKVGYSLVQGKLPTHLLDEFTVPYDITQYYPYYTNEDRDGVNFIECILLLNIYTTAQGRTLYMLNKKATSYDDKRRIRNLVSKLIENMNSEQMFKLYVHVFFDIYEEVVYEMHHDLGEKSLRLAWLPKNSKDAKDAFATFEKYKKRLLKKYANKNYDEWQINTIIINENSIDIEEAEKSIRDFEIIDDLVSLLFPLAFYLLTERDGYASFFYDSPKRKTAQKYARIIEMYIKQAITETENLLSKIYIENI